MVRPFARLLTRVLACTAGFLACAAGPVSAGSVQDLVDAAAAGDIVEVPPGTYEERVVVTKPITLDGGGKAIIDAGGEGSVVVLQTDGATVRNLTLRNSGRSHNSLDSGVQVRGKYNVVKDNVIEDVLFGVDLQQASNNIVRRNTISSKDVDLGVRGDAVRLWYSMDNKITDNVIKGARDFVVWYSARNDIVGNRISGGRYGLHFMYAKYNLIKGNVFADNSVGIFLMYSDDVVIEGNRISRGHGATGMGIGLKESSNVDIVGNEILYSATGLYLDVSPFQPDTTNRVYNNTIAFNSIGIKFLNDWTGNLIKGNRFQSNLHQVSVEALASAKRNTWEGNYWDDYEGFDRDQDGIGDNPYDAYVYADRLWMDVPEVAFFKGAPVLTTMDFLERLAPFTEPVLMLRDPAPRMSPDDLATYEPPARTLDDEADDDDDGAPARIDPFGLKSRLK